MQLFFNCNGTKKVALDKNSCIKQVINIHFSYNLFFANTTFHKAHILTLKWKYLKHQCYMMINELSKLNEQNPTKKFFEDIFC
jgi:hypothetical protein